MNNLHDTSYKDLFSNKQVFVDFIRNFVDSPWSKLLKEEHLSFIDKSFILEDYEKIESDLIYKANINGDEIIFYILLEFQSSVDYSMPIRLFFYMSSCLRDIVKNTPKNKLKQKNFKLPAIIPLVLYNGKNKWNVPLEFKDKIYKADLFGDSVINFKYILFDINSYSKNELTQKGDVSSAIFLIEQNRDIDNFFEKIFEIAFEFNKLSQKDRNIIIHWVRNNKADSAISDIVEQILSSDKSEVEKMTTNYQKVIYEFEQKNIQIGKNIGIEEGRNIGIKEGRDIGIKEGRNIGIKEGRNIGIEEGILKVANNLLDILDDETISLKTGLSVETIKNLRKNN